MEREGGKTEEEKKKREREKKRRGRTEHGRKGVNRDDTKENKK